MHVSTLQVRVGVGVGVEVGVWAGFGVLDHRTLIGDVSVCRLLTPPLIYF